MKTAILIIAFLFVSINSCYCAGDSLVINFKNGTSHKILLDDIKSIKFVDMTGVDYPVNQSVMNMIGNFPNPFQQSTNFKINLLNNADVQINIFDNTGKLVRDLTFKGCSSGENVLPWDGSDANGCRLQSGVYFYEVHCGKEVMSRKMILIN